MTIEEAKEEIRLAILEEDTFKHLDTVREMSVWLNRMVSGKDQEDWVRNVRPDETDREKEHRIRVYKPVTKSCINPVRSFYRKIYRVDGIRSVIGEEEEEAVREAIDNFHGGESLFEYIKKRQPIMEFSDPNGYLVVGVDVERDAVAVRGMSVFPIEVPSSEIVRKQEVNGLTQWIIRAQVLSREEDREVKVFTLYGPGIVLVYEEMEEGQVPEEGQEIDFVDGENSETYIVTAVENNLVTEFPGIRWGAYLHESGEYCVSAIDPASDTLDELVYKKAIYDVAFDNHVRPHRYEYDDPCDYESEKGSCQGRGYLNPYEVKNREHKHICPECKGTGSKKRTESNVTKLVMPDYDAAGEIFPLEKLYHYEMPDLDTVREIKGEIEDLKRSIPVSIFSAQAENTPVVSKTATENLIEADQINNRVFPVAQQASRIWVKVVRITGMYMNREVEPSHSFPENLKLESLSQLIARLASAKDAGATQEAIFAFQCEITEKTHAGNMASVENMKAFERHRPWRSLPEGMIEAIRRERGPEDYDRKLLENFDTVKTEILEERPNFYEIDFAQQKRLIRAKLDQLEIIRATDSEPQQPFTDELEEGEEGESRTNPEAGPPTRGGSPQGGEVPQPAAGVSTGGAEGGQ
ncbi:hypothetical protein [Lewinella sp. W8]|uniref:hypothetical protein n=1 Tax=Lewinella sp. W8 TaxID=2528208 RepID=UPI001067A748|nr:hypothetical protein [Lewinella sp. W8]MTB53010.1 hypothetical protein [Lewinella sp. W8]